MRGGVRSAGLLGNEEGKKGGGRTQEGSLPEQLGTHPHGKAEKGGPREEGPWGRQIRAVSVEGMGDSEPGLGTSWPHTPFAHRVRGRGHRAGPPSCSPAFHLLPKDSSQPPPRPIPGEGPQEDCGDSVFGVTNP